MRRLKSLKETGRNIQVHLLDLEDLALHKSGSKPSPYGVCRMFGKALSFSPIISSNV